MVSVITIWKTYSHRITFFFRVTHILYPSNVWPGLAQRSPLMTYGFQGSTSPQWLNIVEGLSMIGMMCYNRTRCHHRRYIPMSPCLPSIIPPLYWGTSMFSRHRTCNPWVQYMFFSCLWRCLATLYFLGTWYCMVSSKYVCLAVRSSSQRHTGARDCCDFLKYPWVGKTDEGDNQRVWLYGMKNTLDILVIHKIWQ